MKESLSSFTAPAFPYKLCGILSIHPCMFRFFRYLPSPAIPVLTVRAFSLPVPAAVFAGVGQNRGHRLSIRNLSGVD